MYIQRLFFISSLLVSLHVSATTLNPAIISYLLNDTNKEITIKEFSSSIELDANDTIYLDFDNATSYALSPALPVWGSLDTQSGKVSIQGDGSTTGHFIFDVIVNGSKVYKDALKISFYENPEHLFDTINSAATVPLEVLSTSGDILDYYDTFFLPNPDRMSWSALNIFHANYYTHAQELVTDLATNTTVNAPASFSDHLFQAFDVGYTDTSKTYILSKTRRDGETPPLKVHIHTFDTATKKWTADAVAVPNAHQPSDHYLHFFTGTDKTLYSLALGTSYLSILEINPKTNATKFYDNVNAGSSTPDTIAADDQYIYMIANAYGPSKLIAINRESAERTTLFESSNIKLIQHKLGVTAELDPDRYWLYHGVMTKAPASKLNDDSLIPWGADSSDLENASAVIDDLPEAITSYKTESIIPIKASSGKFWYKTASDVEYHSVDIPALQKYPSLIRYMQKIDSERFFVGGVGYTGYRIYNAKEDKIEKVMIPIKQEGSDASLAISNYTSLYINNSVYFSGYPTAGIYKYDLSKKYDYAMDDAYNPNETKLVENPQKLGSITPFTGIKSARNMTVGADGFLYLTGKRVRNTGNGGGLAWMNLKTQIIDGIAAPFDNYNSKDVVRAGKYIVLNCSGNSADIDSRLIVFDTQSKTVVRSLDIDERTTYEAGSITSFNNDEVYVYTWLPTSNGSVFTKTNVETGEVMYAKEYKISNYFSGMVVGDDGYIYLSTGWYYLLRVDPQSGLMEMVTKDERMTKPVVFENSLYFTDKEYFRRFQNYKVRYENK